MGSTNHPKKEGHAAGGERVTKQSFANDADINTLVKRHLGGAPGRTLHNIGDPRASRQPKFFDMPSASFHEMLNSVTDVQAKFASLSAKTRARFGNSPYQLLRFVENPENLQEAVKLGFVADPDILEAMADKEAAETAEQLKREQEAAGQQNMMPRADPEAQPGYKPPEGGKRA